ncbi:hypothetical protein [Pararhodobacter oceanensis]|uniref:hypothetical protein n=1 Tax=Pararhodobacter oceanensis TaxID=2172121 RepID=UPI003A914FE1
MVMSWIGFSVFAMINGLPDLFQRLGAIGVGAVICHYVYIRYTWRRRGESVSASEAAAFNNLLMAKTGVSDLGKAEEKMLLVHGWKDTFNKQEGRSVVVEGVLLILATLQSGFGDLMVNSIQCGAVEC